MKTQTSLCFIFIFIIYGNIFSQNSIELNFTAVNNSQIMLLDSIYIINLTQGCDTSIYAPHSTLMIENVGISDNARENNGLTIAQNFPNPIRGNTSINLFLPQKDDITLQIQNLIGQKVAIYESTLPQGNHTFTFYPGNEETYILTVFARSGMQSIKMLNIGKNANRKCKIVYLGVSNEQIVYKSEQAVMGFSFAFGDELRFIGYAKTTQQYAGSDMLEDDPQTDNSYLFNIIEGIPCKEEPYIFYDGQKYNTVQLGDQCWLKENLNVGFMINGNVFPSDNDTIEKYCFNNDLENCDIYGGLYKWNEMMQYTVNSGSRGICPEGWHITTDAEWTTATNFLGGIEVAGGKLKEAGYDHWLEPNIGATNEAGFTALPGGSTLNGPFHNIGNRGIWWTSTKYNNANAWPRGIFTDMGVISRNPNPKLYGFSVRCIRGLPPYEWTCGDTIHDSRNDRIYHTIEIGEQCWMQENINIGLQIGGEYNQADNGLIEKYCYNDEEDSCDVYGGLYQWNEMMQYTNQEGDQGICFDGWHVPTDEEWKKLEGEVDSLYAYPNSIWDELFWRGYDAGGNLKETGTEHWIAPNIGATNSSGFSARPGGYRHQEGTFNWINYYTMFWTSNEQDENAWYHRLNSDMKQTYRHNNPKIIGFSVRCLKNLQ